MQDVTNSQNIECPLTIGTVLQLLQMQRCKDVGRLQLLIRKLPAIIGNIPAGDERQHCPLPC
jgi:hypothetical protein